MNINSIKVSLEDQHIMIDIDLGEGFYRRLSAIQGDPKFREFNLNAIDFKQLKQVD